MQNDKIVEWLFQTIGGILLLGVSAAVGFIFREMAALKKDHVDLRTMHAALDAKVRAERDESLRAMDRVETALETINQKLDDLLKGSERR